MNTIDDLRATLRRAAGELDDTERYTRRTAVHARIRAVRRRRATALAATAVVTVVAVAAGGLALQGRGGVDPAAPPPDGGVPERVAVSGYPHELASTRELAPGEEVEAEAGSAVVLTAAGLGGGSATLFADDSPVARLVGDATVSAPVPLSRRADLRVELDGTPGDTTAGLATYEPTGEPAPGPTDGTAVFREQVAGGRLVDSGFASDPSAVTLSVRGALDQVVVDTYCSDASGGRRVLVSVDGGDPVARRCSESTEQGGWLSGLGTGGGHHSVRVALESPAPGVTLGAAAYAPDRGPELLGQVAPGTVDERGRLWRFDTIVPQRGAGEPLTTSIDTQDDVLVRVVARGRGVQVRWSGRDDRGSYRVDDNTPEMLQPNVVLLAGGDYDLEVTGEGAFEAQILVYRPE